MTNKEFQGIIERNRANRLIDTAADKDRHDLLALVGEMRECIQKMNKYTFHRKADKCNPHYGCVCGLQEYRNNSDRLLSLTEGS